MTNFNKSHASATTPQYGFKKGTRLLECKGFDATISELKDNLIGRDVMTMVMNPSRKLFKKSLRYLMFLKRKRTGIVKARGCADYRPQRECITKEESTLHTVSTDVLISICMLIGIQGCHSTVADIPAAFL